MSAASVAAALRLNPLCHAPPPLDARGDDDADARGDDDADARGEKGARARGGEAEEAGGGRAAAAAGAGGAGAAPCWARVVPPRTVWVVLTKV